VALPRTRTWGAAQLSEQIALTAIAKKNRLFKRPPRDLLG
jgi:hypothetical protein